MNAVEIDEAVSKLVEVPLDASEFPYVFLEAFGYTTDTLQRLFRRVTIGPKAR